MLNPLYIIKLSSSSKTSLKIYTSILLSYFNNWNINYSNSSFPKTKKRITLLKSTHVNKKAKEHFEIESFKNTILIHSLIKINVLNILFLNKPRSVNIKIKILER